MIKSILLEKCGTVEEKKLLLWENKLYIYEEKGLKFWEKSLEEKKVVLLWDKKKINKLRE